MKEAVAIVGLGGVFPGADSPRGLWDRVLAGDSAAREVPEGRWLIPKDQAYDAARGAPDKVYSKVGCFVDPFILDAAGLDLEPGFLAGLDPVFHFALKAGREAFLAAKTRRLDRRRVGVALGNIALPTDAFSAFSRGALASDPGAAAAAVNRYAAGLPAGILARALGLGGGAMTLDAACASSLYALKLAAEELLGGRADAMLAGGVSRPDCLYTQMGFSQLRALSASGRCSPFDASADGLVVGEGAGIFLLKRLSDALKAGDRVWAVVRGIGLSNDVGGSLLAPDGGGQLRAMRQAYTAAGWSPWDAGLVECHATGTPVGDAVELASLRELWKGAPAGRRAVIGSVKSNIGHLLTGAGAAGLTKALFALNDGVLPPSANFERPAPGAGLAESPFDVLSRPRAWEGRGPRRAAVSAFGFGGINAHVLLEEWRPPRARAAAAKPRPAAPVPVAIVGMDARVGELSSLREFQEAVLSGARPRATMDEVSVPAAAFRIPPKEIEEMLPQQLLMLATAAGALSDAKAAARDHERTGVFIGMELDCNTANFHFRWSRPPRSRDGAGPALTANRTMGALGGIIASRIAREFKIGGPSFTLACEEASGLRALEAGLRALQRRELDCALVGAVDLCGDPRHVAAQKALGRGGTAADGAAAFVLKRLEDAARDGDRVYAVVRGLGAACGPGARLRAAEAARKEAGPGAEAGLLEIDSPGEAPTRRSRAKEPRTALGSLSGTLGRAGAASSAVALAKASLALYQQILPASDLDGEASPSGSLFAPAAPQFWLRNRSEGPRRAEVSALGLGGTCLHAVLEEAEDQPSSRARIERRQPLGARSEALFLVEADDVYGLREGLRRLGSLSLEEAGIEALARRWLGRGNPGRLAVSLVARDRRELARLAESASARLEQTPDAAFNGHGMDRAFYSPSPLGAAGKLAFVFPGSGNHYLGMGLGLGAQWPEILRDQDRETPSLKDQLGPRRFSPWLSDRSQGWEERALAELDADHPSLILGQVAYGSAAAALARALGMRPSGAVGYSLGETAALFALGAWKDRHEMLRRVRRSPLFSRDLAGPCLAARKAWRLPAKRAVDWSLGVVDRPPEAVRAALDGLERAYLLIVNSPGECVVGGDRAQVSELVARLACAFLPVSGVTTVHCPVAKAVERAYHALHLLPTDGIAGARVFSGAWGRGYAPSREAAARSVTDQALGPVDFPKTVLAAYEEGFRLFVELGPRGTTSRMIGQILAGKPHFARSADLRGQDEVSSWLRLLAALAAERSPLDLGFLYGRESFAVGHLQPEPAVARIRVPVGPPRPLDPEPESAPTPAPKPPPTPEDVPVAAAAAHAAAHARFLSLASFSAEAQGRLLTLRSELLGVGPAAREPKAAPAFLDRGQCLEFARGRIAPVLGPDFAEVDSHPTRVRLPDEPLMLVDRVLTLEGSSRSLGSGKIVTEHDARPGAWYLDGGRVPTCIAVEAGQADLLLSGYLGIDFATRGLARYRLLDAVVSFSGELPPAGKILRYDIRIDRFSRQGGAYLFHFRFDATVEGRPLLSMRDGCAGFFTEGDLAAGKGIVFTELDRRPQAGKRPRDWEDLVPMKAESFDDSRVESLRRGDLPAAFGPDFAGLPLSRPLALPGGKMRLIDRVLELDPSGGRYGLGLIRAESDIHPDDWFLTCHFVDDQVMPGTLMYECCLHALRVYLMRMGWVGEDSLRWEPLPGVKSRLKCRGQVLPETKKAVYEIWIKELGYGPEPYAIADALMYSDGKPIVLISDMSLRLNGASRESLRALWRPKPAARRPALYGPEKILAFAVGNPSEAFGDRYKIFDRERVIARLPGPPYQFLDRVVSIEGAKPWTLEPGGVIEAEYDVPPDAWYFSSARSPSMPFAVLLEAALQPCGWLAAYLGSALRSETDVSFRNLGGKAVMHREVGPGAGTLVTRVKITKVSLSGGMIIQNYDMSVRTLKDGAPVYTGDTYFGFFSKQALAEQRGVLGVTPYAPSEEEVRRGLAFVPADALPLPDPRLRMLDAVSLHVPDGGPMGLGFLRATKRVDPAEWFFKAHFHQDPVCPGSLGLESFLQLLTLAAARRWGPEARFKPALLGVPHEWVYRGQILPANREAVVEAAVTSADDAKRTLTGDGFLSVDGLRIYQMKGFGVEAL